MMVEETDTAEYLLKESFHSFKTVKNHFIGTLTLSLLMPFFQRRNRKSTLFAAKFLGGRHFDM
jgi:hypothetical protein